ncbi:MULTISPECIES: hypothetical protein [unclassified Roseovarius]|uniref:hypothetical protein n=1 Tax=unclassified Roseovarius TaxID=2614913 RepID=UPI00273FA6C2|nr:MULTISPECIES: hypothetical protein [unclassified Roseovarius]
MAEQSLLFAKPRHAAKFASRAGNRTHLQALGLMKPRNDNASIPMTISVAPGIDPIGREREQMSTYVKDRIANPSQYYEAPKQILDDEKLSLDDKEKVLRSLADEIEQKIDAAAEGMETGDDPATTDDLRNALIELDKLRDQQRGA